MSISKVNLPGDPQTISTVVGEITINRVSFDVPWEWLAKGWRDVMRIPSVSLTYGVIFALAAVALAVCLVQFEWVSLMLPLSGGFLLLGPLFAIGLYDASRRLERGEKVTLKSVVTACCNGPGQIGFMGVVLLLAFFAWMEIAFLMFMLFLGGSGLPPVGEFVSTLLFTGRGLGLLVFGSIMGGILAAVVFAISAISVPLVLTKEIDVVTAVLTSVTAVRKNPRAMWLWAILIAALMLFGIATAFIGLIAVFPLIGHATWHAFRDLISFEAAEP